MSSGNYLPARDEDFNAWGANFSNLITLAPTSYGLVALDATTLAGLVTAFDASLTTAIEPTTRTSVTVAEKDAARAALTVEIRGLVKRIQATKTVTIAQKTALGLTANSGVRTPVPPPATRPLLSVLANAGLSQTLRVIDAATPTKRARPDGTKGAEVYTFVGSATDVPPGDLEQWRFEGLATRWQFNITYNPADAGKTAHIKAVYFNEKGQSGPVSDEVVALIAA